ncbi:MAG TPA: hypothetical protein VHV78_02005 [Gemmatimonadaceae bacterium]|jgi:hypothetical protein|nr:hypothetical protein [Gemmatimonadaceae bacterium]
MTRRAGVIDVVDHAALEREACERHEIIRAEFDRLLGFRDVPTVLPNLQASVAGLSTLGDGGPSNADGES